MPTSQRCHRPTISLSDVFSSRFMIFCSVFCSFCLLFCVFFFFVAGIGRFASEKEITNWLLRELGRCLISHVVFSGAILAL